MMLNFNPPKQLAPESRAVMRRWALDWRLSRSGFWMLPKFGSTALRNAIAWRDLNLEFEARYRALLKGGHHE